MGSEVAVYDGETGELELSRPPEPALLDVRARAEIETLVRTARQYPRSFKRFKAFSQTMACDSLAIAASCTYAKPIGGGKYAIGPSVRLAEIMVPAWGNCSVTARIVEENDRFIVAQGTAIDFESNCHFSVEVTRRITDRNGRKFSDDMVMNAANAARSIAFRTVAFLMIPRALVEEIRLKAVEVANGKQSTQELLDKTLAHFASLGVEEKRVVGAMGVLGRADLNLEHVETLRAVAQAIRDGETTAEAAFPRPEQPASPPTKGTDGLRATLEAKSKAEPAAKGGG